MFLYALISFSIFCNFQTLISPLGRDLHPEEIIIKLGYTSQPKDPNGQDYRVKRFRIHPKYRIANNNELYHDLGIITLASRIKITKFINPVCLPESNLMETIYQKDNLTLSGFGYHYNHVTLKWEKPQFLQMTEDIRKLPVDYCLFDKEKQSFKGFFCAGNGLSYDEVGHYTADSCQGDSGSPLTYKDPHTERQSFIYQNC